MATSQTKFLKDIIAGLTTSFAAIALGAAFGVESGRGAFAGMIAAGIIPIITSIFGGTRLQASGPTAPMTAVTVLLISYAYSNEDLVIHPEGFITLTLLLMALIMILGGLLKLGRLISFIPNVVIIGFMNGISVSIWWSQLTKMFGLSGSNRIEGNLMLNVFFAVGTLVFILSFPYLLKLIKVSESIRPFIPGTLFSIAVFTGIFLLSGFDLETVELGSQVDTFSEFQSLVISNLPVREQFNINILLLALPFALQLALLCYLDSLLTSLVIDKLTNETTQKNKELIAQGLSNGISGILGGIPGAQATIRSVLLIKEGANSRFAGIFVGIFALAGAIIFKNYITLVAYAIFIGVLIKAGWDVFEKEFFTDFLKKKGWSNENELLQLFLALLTTIVTVAWDLNIAVIFGTILFYIFKRWLSLKDAGETEQTAITSEA